MKTEDFDVLAEGASDEGLYAVSQDQIFEIVTALEENDRDAVKHLIAHLDYVNISVVIQYLPPVLRHDFIEVLRPGFDPHVLSELEETVRDEVATQLGIKDLVRVLRKLESDDAFAIIEALDDKARVKILNAMPAGDRVILQEVLNYPEGSAARLMQREIVCIPSFWTSQKAREYIRKDKDLPDTFYDVFVVDPKHCPVGSIPLSELLRANKMKKVSELMREEVKVIPAVTDQEEVAMLFRNYNLISAPVVDEAGRIIGMITIDDVVDVIDQEAQKDIMHLGGVSESDFFAPLHKTSYWRIRWLSLAMVNSIVAVLVINHFEHLFAQMAVLAVLMPVSAAMAGNSGMQTVTIAVRALATRELGLANMWRAVNKEILVGLINGVFFGILMTIIVSFWFNDLMLGFVLAASLISNMAWAAFAGIMLPLAFDKMGLDPAVGAVPFLMTSTDVLGYSIFLYLASVFLI